MAAAPHGDLAKKLGDMAMAAEERLQAAAIRQEALLEHVAAQRFLLQQLDSAQVALRRARRSVKLLTARSLMFRNRST
jgi:hypothetical protein